MSSDTTQSQVIGIIIGALLTAFGVFLQFILTDRRDRRRSEEAKEKRKTIAYAHLKETVDRIESKSQPKQAHITEDEYDRLQEMVADYYDVLERSTVKAWNSKRILRRVYGDAFAYEIDLDQFCQDVKQHIQRQKND